MSKPESNHADADDGSAPEPLEEALRDNADAIARLRSALSDGNEVADDLVVYRFLRGYKGDEEAAGLAMDRMATWRRENGVDEVGRRSRAMERVPQDLPHFERISQCHPHNVHHGFDRHGQPLSIERLGRTDPALLTRLLTADELMEYHLHHVEYKTALVNRLSREKGVVLRTCKVLDLDGLSTRALHRGGLAYFRSLIKVSQDNYPEMLGSVFIINAPRAFHVLWRVVRPWLSPHTLEKIHILGSDYPEVLARHIDPSCLPPWAGGTCASCEPHGCVPERNADEGMTEVVLSARGREDIVVEVPGPSYVAWEFRAVKKDFQLAITFSSDADAGATRDDDVPVAPPTRTESTRGDWKADRPGFLHFTVSNEFSYFTGKTIMYAVATNDIIDEADNVECGDGE